MNLPKFLNTTLSFKLQATSFRLLVCSLWLLLIPSIGNAQENIPLGTWRIHLSFNSVKHVVAGNAKIFAASESGVLQYDLEDKSFIINSTLNTLSTTGISTLAYDEIRKQLIVGYEDGNLDFIGESSTINFTRLVNPPDILVTPQINSIYVNASLAYISTNYGVVVYDLTRNEVRESWRNLGSTGQLLAVFKSSIKNDSIYLATAKGILAGRLTDNLLDFSKWTRYETGELDASIKTLTVFNNKIYAAIDNIGVYQFTGSEWIKELTMPIAINYTFLQSYNDVLLVGGDKRAWKINLTKEVIEITDLLIKDINEAVLASGKEWIADNKAGLLSNQSGKWLSYLPSGPVASITFKSKFITDNIITIHGSLLSDLYQGDESKVVSKLERGVWSSINTQLAYHTDLEKGASQSVFIASFGEGLEQLKADGTSNVYNNTNSPLENSIANTQSIYITDIENSPQGLWIANYGANNSLHLLKPDNTWQSFNHPSARYPFKLAVDFNNNVWTLLSKNNGGGVFIMEENGDAVRNLTDQPGKGLLPNKEVLSMAVDKEGYVWIGTAKGICYYTYTNEDAIRPIVDGGYLLSEEKITAIAIDGGNRKWIGTERGLWLFDNNGETAVYNFTTENSPLPSNVIIDVEINNTTGEVFIATQKGLFSFRADATQAEASTQVKIFPNPVTSNFTGLVGFSGLYANATVKITDVSGTLINQLQANGGTASWNIKDYKGKRVNTGVYLVIASAQDGSESIAGKIIVVE